jgi:hypothetical protein
MTPVAKSQGEIRMSQVVNTFGPGSMVDLPNYAVLIAGLDYWNPQGGETITDERLSQKLAKVLEVPRVELRTPPAADRDPSAPRSDITGFQFPEWFITQDLEVGSKPGTRTRLLIHRSALSRGKYIDRDRKKRPVVPVRFVRACRAGHIGDINWYNFVHRGTSQCAGRQLYIDERGTSGDLSENWVRCDCGKAERNLGDAALLSTRALESCDGKRPWLGPATREDCGEPNRLLIRSASNAYFPQKMSVISLPDRDKTVRQAVDGIWTYVETVETIDNLRYERKKARVREALEGLSDEEVFADLEARKTGASGQEKSVKVAELETLVSAKDELARTGPKACSLLGPYHASAGTNRG